MPFKAVSGTAISMMFGPSVFAALVFAGMSMPSGILDIDLGRRGAADRVDGYHESVPGLSHLWGVDGVAAALSPAWTEIDSASHWGAGETAYACRVDPVTGLAMGDDGTAAGITFNELGLLQVLAALRDASGSDIGLFPFVLPPEPVVADAPPALVAEAGEDVMKDESPIPEELRILLSADVGPAAEDAVDALLIDGIDLALLSSPSRGGGSGARSTARPASFGLGVMPAIGPVRPGSRPSAIAVSPAPRGFASAGRGGGPFGLGALSSQGGVPGGVAAILLPVPTVPSDPGPLPISFPGTGDSPHAPAGGGEPAVASDGAGTVAVPEPAAIILFLVGLGALVWSRRSWRGRELRSVGIA